MRRAARTDQNQQEIVRGLRRRGHEVCILAQVGRGVPDLLVVDGERPAPYADPTGLLVLMEVKMPGAQLTDDEEKWRQRWPGPVYIVHSLDEALDAIETERRRVLGCKQGLTGFEVYWRQA